MVGRSPRQLLALTIAVLVVLGQAACGGGGGGSPTGLPSVQALDIGGVFEGSLVVTSSGGGCVGATLNGSQFPATADSAWWVSHPRSLVSPAEVFISDAFDAASQYLRVDGWQISADGTSDENGVFSATHDVSDCGDECIQEFECSNGKTVRMVWLRSDIEGQAAHRGRMTGTVESVWSIREADDTEIARLRVSGDLDCSWVHDV